MAPSASVGRKVVVDATRVVEEVSPVMMSMLLLYMCTYRQIHCCHTSLIHERMLGNRKKKLRMTPQNCVLRTAPPERLPHTPLSSVCLRFCFFGHFSTEGTEVKSASVTQTEVEL
jgi:hypothetical protein